MPDPSSKALMITLCMYLSVSPRHKLFQSLSAKFFALLDETQKLEQVDHVLDEVSSAAALPAQLHQVPAQSRCEISTQLFH